MPDISVVIPVLDEAENILPLAAELAQTFSGTSWTWECLWVDDGSRDRTGAVLERLTRTDGRHRALVLAAHAGQSVALVAGFTAAHGAIVCTLDGDGQNDPADLPRFVEILQSQNADLVAGFRENRRDDWLKRLTSFVGNSYRNAVTGHRVRDTGCSTRAMKQSALMTIPFFSGMHRFFPTLFQMRGYRVIVVPANHRPRLKGRTKYGIRNRLGAGLLDCFGVLWLSKRTPKYSVVQRAAVVDAEGGRPCGKSSG